MRGTARFSSFVCNSHLDHIFFSPILTNLCWILHEPKWAFYVISYIRTFKTKGATFDHTYLNELEMIMIHTNTQ